MCCQKVFFGDPLSFVLGDLELQAYVEGGTADLFRRVVRTRGKFSDLRKMAMERLHDRISWKEKRTECPRCDRTGGARCRGIGRFVSGGV
jgi:hypothetical protein